jgi:predicted secreted protein
MALAAGHVALVTGHSSNASYATIAGVKDVKFSTSRGEVDVTQLGDTAEDIILGIKKCSISISGAYNHADTETALIESQYMSSDGEYWLKYLPNASTGYYVQCRITSIEYGSATGDDAANWTVNLRAIAAWVAV